jgi:hypothetical protein
MRGKYWLIGLTAVVVLGYVLMPGWGVGARGVTAGNLSMAKQLAYALKFYAEKHDGSYPKYLSELVPDYLTAWDCVPYYPTDSAGKTEEKYDWLYFGAGSNDKQARHIIIASPQVARKGKGVNKRIVVYNDLSAVVIEEGPYQRELRQMSDNTKKTQTPSHPAASGAGISPQP